MINLNFFKNQNGEYRVTYTSSNSLIYNSELDDFIKKLDKEIEEFKNSKVAIKVGNDFILANKKDSLDISLEDTKRKVIVDDKEYSLNRGTTFNESQKVDDLIDSGKYEAFKIEDYEEKNDKDLENKEAVQGSLFDYLNEEKERK